MNWCALAKIKVIVQSYASFFLLTLQPIDPTPSIGIMILNIPFQIHFSLPWFGTYLLSD